MELVLIIAVIVVGIVALFLVSRNDDEEKTAMENEMKASGIDPDRQFRRPPNEGDLL
jgi:hypothetical protein